MTHISELLKHPLLFVTANPLHVMWGLVQLVTTEALE
jgi:hypothetical protein